MNNILIIESNIIEACFLTNYISKQIPNVRIYNIALNGIEAIDIIKNNRVDIILLDSKFLEITKTDIIKYISKNNLIKFKKSILIYCEDKEITNSIMDSMYIFSYCNMNNLIYNINDLLSGKMNISTNNVVKEKIKTELEKLHFNFTYSGTKYLFECIYECYCRNKKNNINLTKEIYAIISKKYHKTINTIKVDIFKATDIMYYETDIDVLSNYFGYEILKKPKTKDIITHILQKI